MDENFCENQKTIILVSTSFFVY